MTENEKEFETLKSMTLKFKEVIDQYPGESVYCITNSLLNVIGNVVARCEADDGSPMPQKEKDHLYEVLIKSCKAVLLFYLKGEKEPDAH